jgi:hypothetical protein
LFSFGFHFYIGAGEKMLGVKRESMMKFYDAEGNVPLHSAVHSGDIKVNESIIPLCLYPSILLLS